MKQTLFCLYDSSLAHFKHLTCWYENDFKELQRTLTLTGLNNVDALRRTETVSICVGVSLTTKGQLFQNDCSTNRFSFSSEKSYHWWRVVSSGTGGYKYFSVFLQIMRAAVGAILLLLTLCQGMFLYSWHTCNLCILLIPLKDWSITVIRLFITKPRIQNKRNNHLNKYKQVPTFYCDFEALMGVKNVSFPFSPF